MLSKYSKNRKGVRGGKGEKRIRRRGIPGGISGGIPHGIPHGRRNWVKEEDGFGVVEVILILVILIGLVVIFKSQITSIVEDIFEAITSGVSEVLG